MKKFIFTINIAALLALVPAVFIGYLHNDAADTDNRSTETVKDSNNGAEDATTIHLVKTF